MTKLLVLRPQPGADATARRVRTMGFEAVVAPLFEIRPIAWEAPAAAGFDALLLTSANAVRHAGPGLAQFLHLPVFAVGAATASAATDAGFTSVVTGTSDAAAIAAQAAGRRLLHLAGRENRKVAGATQRIVYAAEPVDRPLPPAEVALLHSPRAARYFAQRHPGRNIAIGALSPAVAEAAGAGWKAVAIAEHPDDESLLAAVARLCDQGALGDGDPE